MNSMVLVGGLMVCFGLFTGVARQTNPGMFSKLEAMKKMWGAGAGFAMHVFSYTIVPIGAGTVFILRGLGGATF